MYKYIYICILYLRSYFIRFCHYFLHWEVGVCKLLQGQPFHAPLMALGCGAGPLCWASGWWGAMESSSHLGLFGSKLVGLLGCIWDGYLSSFQGQPYLNFSGCCDAGFVSMLDLLGDVGEDRMWPGWRLPGRCSHCVWGWPCRGGTMYSTTRPCVGEGRGLSFGPRTWGFEVAIGLRFWDNMGTPKNSNHLSITINNTNIFNTSQYNPNTMNISP